MKISSLDFIILFVFIGWSYAFPLKDKTLNIKKEYLGEYVSFYLYTKADPENPHQIFLNNSESVLQSRFDKSRPTKFLIHGWGGSYLTSPNPDVRKAYFTQDDYNIISVDWFPLAKLNYVSAFKSVPSVGEYIGKFVDFLNDKHELDFRSIVVIGHSLGAHVAGFCGKTVKRGILEAIVGLDPALPLYNYENVDNRLSTTDAKYVQTIQTNGNVKGFLKPIGIASFYPNWGQLQPGCGYDFLGTCSHGRSVTLYAEAIKTHSFAPVFLCESFQNILDKKPCNRVQKVAEIGDPLQIKRASGIFYFETKSTAPFGHIIQQNKCNFNHSIFI